MTEIPLLLDGGVAAGSAPKMAARGWASYALSCLRAPTTKLRHWDKTATETRQKFFQTPSVVDILPKQKGWRLASSCIGALMQKRCTTRLQSAGCSIACINEMKLPQSRLYILASWSQATTNIGLHIVPVSHDLHE